MNKNSSKEFGSMKAVSAKTHPSPDRDSKFYRKFKPALPLSNPIATYNKHRKRLLDR